MFIFRASNKGVQYSDKYYLNINYNNAVNQEFNAFNVCHFLPCFTPTAQILVSSFLVDKGSCSPTQLTFTSAFYKEVRR